MKKYSIIFFAMICLFLSLNVIPSLAQQTVPIGLAIENGHSAPTVGMVTRHWYDTDRENWQQTGPRPLLTVIWYPSASNVKAKEITMGPPQKPLFIAGRATKNASLSSQHKTYPLILLSHGSGGSALQMMWLGQSLAEHGYIVAAVNHYGNTGVGHYHYTPQGFMLWWERAQDLRVVLNKLLTDPVFGPRIDRNRIGAAGYSLGGYTVIETAGGRTNLTSYLLFCMTPQAGPECSPEAVGLPPHFIKKFRTLMGSNTLVKRSLGHSANSYRDQRIKAVFAIEPAVGEAVTAQSLRKIGIPVEIVVGAGDHIAPAKHNAARYARLIPNARLITLSKNVHHYTFLDECTAAGRKKLPHLCIGTNSQRAAVHRHVAKLALAFFHEHLGKANIHN